MSEIREQVAKTASQPKADTFGDVLKSIGAILSPPDPQGVRDVKRRQAEGDILAGSRYDEGPKKDVKYPGGGDALGSEVGRSKEYKADVDLMRNDPKAWRDKHFGKEWEKEMSSHSNIKNYNKTPEDKAPAAKPETKPATATATPEKPYVAPGLTPERKAEIDAEVARLKRDRAVATTQASQVALTNPQPNQTREAPATPSKGTSSEGKGKVSIGDVMRANPKIHDANKITAGDTIQLPNHKSYTIKTGDTLSGILKAHNKKIKED